MRNLPRVTESVLCLFMAAITFWECQALPDGPPTAACRTMQPGTRVGEVTVEGHVTRPQNYFPMYGNTKSPPYLIRITPETTHYNPNTDYTVRIVANQTTRHNFYKGILMQARRVICASNETMEVEEDPYGTFWVPSSTSETLLATMECFYEHSSLCHYSPNMKINETATWTSPDSHVGHLVLWATIVQTATVYWTEVHSNIMYDPNDDPLPICAASTIQGHVVVVFCTLFVMFINRRSS